ncbi:MAG TPA: hypothetical protein VGO11_01220 [Chthoniobacteraceae bacterium]|jgi:hypothetical protein|nr:hypothetical protein [Chthoniobacteraceae bacterium]
MADEDVNPAESRTPTLADLVELCRNLNTQGARYLIVGGFAVIQHGYFRSTGDIDVLIEDSLDNQKRVRRALESLPEKAILELGEDEDLRDWIVLRVADEILVDVMTAACGVSYTEAERSIQTFDHQGVAVPFASVRLLLRMKQTHRAKDEEDRVFLQWKIAQEDNPKAD